MAHIIKGYSRHNQERIHYIHSILLIYFYHINICNLVIFGVVVVIYFLYQYNSQLEFVLEFQTECKGLPLFIHCLYQHYHTLRSPLNIKVVQKPRKALENIGIQSYTHTTKDLSTRINQIPKLSTLFSDDLFATTFLTSFMHSTGFSLDSSLQNIHSSRTENRTLENFS